MLGEIGSVIGGLLGQAGEALSAPRRAAWSALGLPESGSELVANTFGMDPDSPWTHALGFGAEVLGDPLTYAGGLIGKLAGRMAGFGKSNIPAMLKARREFGVFKDVDAAAGSAAKSLGSSKMVGKPAFMNEVMSDFEPFHELASRGVVGGWYAPNSRSIFVASHAPERTLRHELSHGLVDAASMGHDGLPLAFKIPAKMIWSNNPFIKGLGLVADEAVGHGMESRNLLGKIKGGVNFLMDPDPYYADLFSKTSPASAAVYRNLPYAAAGTVAAGTAAAAYPFLGD